MKCQVCGKPLSALEEDGLTCFDCIVDVSRGLDDIEAGRVHDHDDVFRELDDEFRDDE